MMKRFFVLMCCLLTAVVLTAAEIVKEGKPAAAIVLGSKPTRSAQMAAFELQYHIEKLTDAKVEILKGTLPAAGTKILVGSSEFVKDVKPFDFQEYLIEAKGDTIIIAGCDEDNFSEVNYSNASSFPGVWDRNGTLYAAYDFLELLGIRWYLPTDLGIAFEPASNVQIPDMVRRRKPTMEMRHIYSVNIPADLCGDTVNRPSSPNLNVRDNQLWYLRRRAGGKQVIINHSMYTFYNRYWPEKKEWFAKGYGTAKPAQLCYTNPEVIAQVAQDARDYFDGKKGPAEVISNVPATYKSDVFPVFPMDNRSFCKCPTCTASAGTPGVTRGVNQFSNDYSSEYLFKFVNAIAREVKKSHPDKLVGAGAYAGFAYPPKGYRLEDNIMLMMCLHTRLVFNKGVVDNDDRILNSWVKEYPDMKKYVWMYWCFPTLEGRAQQFRIFPGFFAEHVDPIFRKYRKANVCGLFWEPSYIANSQQSVLFDQVEGHIIWSLAWDESRDGAKLFDDFFRLYYGPAEKPMKEWYRFAQSIFTKPATHKHQTDEIAWKQLGTKENMAKLAGYIAQAKKLAVAEPYKSRFELFEKGVWQYMQKGKQRGDEMDALKAPSMQQCAIPCVENPEPGNSLKVPWGKAAQLRMYGGLRAENPTKKLTVAMAHDEKYLYLKLEETGIDTKTLRRDNIIWINDEWELYFGKTRGNPYRQLGVDVNGKYEGYLHLGIVKESWDFKGKTLVNSGDKWWIANVAIPLEDLTEEGVKPGEFFYGNIIRSANTQCCGIWIPTFAGYHQPDRFGEFYLVPKK